MTPLPLEEGTSASSDMLISAARSISDNGARLTLDAFCELIIWLEHYVPEAAADETAEQILCAIRDGGAA